MVQSPYLRNSGLFASCLFTLSLFIAGNFLSHFISAESTNTTNTTQQSSEPSLQDFRLSLSNIVNQSNALTAAYQDEIGKWQSHEYDNATLASVTDSYLPKFERLANKAQNLTYPADYKNVSDALVSSLKSETDSNKYFRDYLLSGNETVNEISIDLLSKAQQYEQVYSKFLANSSSTNEKPLLES
jgi:hypothetical protein